MLISSEKTGTNEYTLKVCVEKEAFEKAVNQVYNKQKNKIEIKGFRKGKAPRNIIEKVYGKDVFYGDAIEEAFPAVYEAAVAEAGITTVSSPRDFDVDFEAANGPEITLKVDVKPEITIEGYKGIEAVKTLKEVTDADVDAALDAEIKKNGREIAVEDRAAEDGDVATIDFEGFVDGVAFDGGKGEDYDLTLGSGSFIPGFEEQVAGHSIGEEFDVNVTFPEQYAEELAGKEAVFKIKLHAIKKIEYPAADDDFAKEVSDFDTIDEYKADLRKTLTEKAENEARTSFENNVYDKLAELVEGEIPESMYDNAVDNMVQEFTYSIAQQGMRAEDYLKQLGMSIDTLKGFYRPRAEKDVKIELALEKIAANEGIEVSDEDVADTYAKYAEQYKIEVEDCKKYFEETALRASLAKEKASKFVVENAVAVDAPAEEEAPAEEAEATEE